MEKKAKKPPIVRLWSGILVLIIGFLSPLLIPLVLVTGWSTGVKSVISGLLAFGIPELFMIIAVGIMGKEGFNYLKRYLSFVLRRYGPPDEVSLIRYRIGLIMFVVPLIVSVIVPYFGHKIAFFENQKTAIMIILHTMLFLSLFVLGGDFWEKLRGLFIRSAKIDLQSKKNKTTIMLEKVKEIGKKALPKTEVTKAILERGQKQLLRLSVLIDVLYALMIYKLFTLMPNPDIDGFGREELYSVLTKSYLNYTVILIGVVLVILYWGLSNSLFGNLKHTNSAHATLSILQIFSLMLYIYFVRLDAQFPGEISLMVLQSILLAIAGFLSVFSWHYALKNNLVSDAPTKKEREQMYIKLLPEPVVSVLTLPLAFFGPVIWTLGWLLLIPAGWITKKYSSRIKVLKTQES